MKNDPVNRPNHYTSTKYEVIDIIEAFELDFHLGNVVKYILRHKHKGGLEDLRKGKWYLDRYILNETKKEKKIISETIQKNNKQCLKLYDKINKKQ